MAHDASGPWTNRPAPIEVTEEVVCDGRRLILAAADLPRTQWMAADVDHAIEDYR